MGHMTCPREGCDHDGDRSTRDESEERLPNEWSELEEVPEPRQTIDEEDQDGGFGDR